VFNGVVSPPTGGNILQVIIITIVLGFVGAAICVFIGLFLLLALIFWTLLSPFSAHAQCKRKQTLFRLRHCIFGNDDPNITL
jgi:ABC-type transport system involved in cytochrome bd biosynthesis fused ATPase/permease subunit